MCCVSGSVKTRPYWKAVTSKPPPSQVCITQTKFAPPPQGLPSSNTTPPPSSTTPKKTVWWKLVFFLSLTIRDHISTLNYKWTYFLTTNITFFIWVFSHISLSLYCLHDSRLIWLHTNWKQSNYNYNYE